MKTTNALVLILIMLCAAGSAAADDAPPINAVVGDASWVAQHGHSPPSRAAEGERIRTHLQYVANLLANKRPALDPSTTIRRSALLAELRRYAAAGRFPRNQHHRGRRPRFIDDRGHLCAVGHLMVASGHSDLATQIDEHHEYDYVSTITAGALGPRALSWARDHGFTGKELATIQPQYGFEKIEKKPLTTPELRLFVTTYEFGMKECLRRQFGTKPTDLSITLSARQTEKEVDRSIDIVSSPALNKRTRQCIREPVEYAYRNLGIHYIVPETTFKTTLRYRHLNAMTPTTRKNLAVARKLARKKIRVGRRQLNRCLTDRHPATTTLKIHLVLHGSGDTTLMYADVSKGMGLEEACVAAALGLERNHVIDRHAEAFSERLSLRRPKRPKKYRRPERNPYE